MAINNTQINVGIRHDFATLGKRNFEPDVASPYLCNREGMEFNGTQYHVGDAIPFDNVGLTAYAVGSYAYLEQCWNSGWLTPQV
jgi:hypothetical protein